MVAEDRGAVRPSTGETFHIARVSRQPLQVVGMFSAAASPAPFKGPPGDISGEKGSRDPYRC